MKMPSILTHYLCGKKSLKLFNKYKKTQMSENVFNLGTQGPDILFFHNQWPWIKKPSISYIGDTIHDKNVNNFFNNMIAYIKNENTDTTLLVSYLMGFCCHQSLDSTTHPYIFYFSGFDENGSLDYKYKTFHRKFETMIDFMMCLHEENDNPYNLNTKKLLNVSDIEILKISKMLKYTIYSTFKINVELTDLSQAIKNFRSITNLLRDKFGLKKFLFSKIESIVKLNNKPSSIIYPLKISDQIDYLNIKNNTWCLPWDNKKISTASFIDLYNISINKTVGYFISISKIFKEDSDPNSLLDLICNSSYSNGVNCSNKIKFLYHKSVYE
jgi:hypothetical protein